MSVQRADERAPARAGRRAARGADLVVGLVVVALTLATALRWLDVQQTAVIALQSARPLVAIASLALLLAVMVAQRWRAAAAAALLVAVHAVVWGPSLVPDDAVPGSDDVVVMVSNVQFGGADAATLLEVVEEQQVDVLVLLEVTASGRERIDAAGLTEALPEEVGGTREDPGGTVVLSRLPLTEVPDAVPATFDQPLVEVATAAGPVLLQAVHPVPPTLPRRWHDELAAIDEWVAEQPVLPDGGPPLVVAGDFNATGDHPVFRRLLTGADRLADAHHADGSGWVRTWPADRPIPPVVHIDHVLVRDLGVLDSGVVDVPGTDHRAVWARLSLP